MPGFKLYVAQRISALVMAPLVFGHLFVMLYAAQGGLSAGEILARTQGSIGWGVFYGLFVLAVAVHAAVGIRVIAFEWAHLEGWLLAVLSHGIGLLLLVLGLYAVYAVVIG